LLNFEDLTAIGTPIGKVNLDDLLLAIITLGSAPAYVAWRTNHQPQIVRVLEVAWLIYVLLLTFSALQAPVTTKTDLFVHLRFTSRFILFFPSVVILNTAERRKIFLWYSVAIAAAGTLFNIAQATRGPVTLFDSPIYSVNVIAEVGDIYRVYLQITNYIVFVFFLSICASIIYRRILITAFSALLSISFLVIYARTLWIGLICGLAAVLATYITQRSFRRRAIATYTFVPIVVLLAGIALSTLSINAFSDVLDRINEGIFAFTTGTGTWGARTDIASTMLSTFNWNNWLFGAGLFGSYWSDLGMIDVFLHLGASGCLAVVFLMASSLVAEVSTIFHCIHHRDRSGQMIGGAATAFTVTLIAYSLPSSNWLQPYTMSVLAVATALSSAILTTPEVRSTRVASRSN
jgi:hypothetical protein